MSLAPPLPSWKYKNILQNVLSNFKVVLVLLLLLFLFFLFFCLDAVRIVHPDGNGQTMEEIPGVGAWISTLSSVHISSLEIGSIDFKPSLLELRRFNVTESKLFSKYFPLFS